MSVCVWIFKSSAELEIATDAVRQNPGVKVCQAGDAEAIEDFSRLERPSFLGVVYGDTCELPGFDPDRMH